MGDELFLILCVASLLVIGGGYYYARWKDPFWKCKTLRSRLKKNYIIIALLSKDKKSFLFDVVDALKDKIKVKDAWWYITEGNIWRAAEVKFTENALAEKSSLKSVGKREEKTYLLDKLKYEDGVPIVFLDEDTMTPVGFEHAPAKVKPNELSAFLQADWMNEFAKMQVANKNLNLYVQLAIVGIVITGYFAYTAYQAVNDIQVPMKAKVDDMSSKIDLLINKMNILPAGGKIVNGTVIITQGG